MTISATTQGLRPGVCTSTSRPSSPFDGMVIYETDTNRVLIWDNSAWVMIADTDSPPGLQLVKTQTIGTAVSTVVVSDVFSADYENYRIIIGGGTSSTDLNLWMTLGSTATGYYWAGNGHSYANATQVGFAANTTSWFAGYGRTASLLADMVVYSPFASDETMYTQQTIMASTTGIFFSGGGYVNNTTSYTSFTITTSTGTITGGTIRVYGFRNS